jgi:hypothetical protein
LSTPPQTTASHAADQFTFARHAFDNYQALIRSVDAKAGALLALAVFLGASLFPIMKDAIPQLRPCPAVLLTLSIAFAASGGAFLLSFLSILHSISGVIRPRGARFYKEMNKMQDLLWQEHIVKHPDNVSYFEAVSNAPLPVLLRNFTDQVFELAHISKEKMGALNNGFRSLYWLLVSWLINLCSGLILLRYKQ